MPGVRARPLSGLLVSSSEDAPSSGGRNTSNSMSPLPHNQRRSYLTYFRPAAGKSGDGVIALSCLTALFVVGTILGFVLPSSDELHGPYRRISAVIGWTYFCRRVYVIECSWCRKCNIQHQRSLLKSNLQHVPPHLLWRIPEGRVLHAYSV